MARLKRIAPLGIPQHIIQRGNNRQVCFASDQDMAFYASLLGEYSKKFSNKWGQMKLNSLPAELKKVSSALAKAMAIT